MLQQVMTNPGEIIDVYKRQVLHHTMRLQLQQRERELRRLETVWHEGSPGMSSLLV